MARVFDPDAALAAEAYFDGASPICRREIAVYRRMAGMEAVAWHDVSDPTVAPAGLDRATALARFHVRRGDGTIVSGRRRWRRNPRLAPLARALDRRTVVPILELGYAVFLRLRPLWHRS